MTTTTATITTIDLVRLVQETVPLRKTAKTKGGEWHGPCPFCGGRDRFYVHEAAGHGGRMLFRCRICGVGGDAIDFLTLRDGVDKGAAMRALGLGGGGPAYGPGQAAAIVAPEPVEPPGLPWQDAALALVESAYRALWEPAGARALGWLRARGLSDATIAAARIGYQPEDAVIDLAGARAWAPRGIVIPWFVGGELWRVNFRRPVMPDSYHLRREARVTRDDHPSIQRVFQALGQLGDATPRQIAERTGQTPAGVAAALAHMVERRLAEPSVRYIPLPGSPNCVYGIDDVRPGQPLALVEGELNVLALRQEAGDRCGVVGLGAATHGRRARWLARIGLARPVLVGLDGDEAGDLHAAYWLGALGPIGHRWRPELKDHGAMLQAGMDLAAWVDAGLGDWERARPAVISLGAGASAVLEQLGVGKCDSCGEVKPGIAHKEICADCRADQALPPAPAPAPAPAPTEEEIDLFTPDEDEIDWTPKTRVRPAPGCPGIQVAHVAAAPRDGQYVGRQMPGRAGSPLGNPFKPGQHDDPIGRFRAWLKDAIRAEQARAATYSQECAVAELRRLLGIYQLTGTLTLVCWCAPGPCHADVVAAAVIWLADHSPVTTAEGVVIWDRGSAELGLPFVTLCPRTGATLRASASIRQARQPLHADIFPDVIQETLA